MKRLYMSSVRISIALITIFLFLTACGGPTTYIFIESEIATPTAGLPTNETPIIPLAPNILDVSWSIDRICNDSKLVEARINLYVSGGIPPYTSSPNNISLTPGENIDVRVSSSDGQIWMGKIKAPENCDDALPGKILPSTILSTETPAIAPIATFTSIPLYSIVDDKLGVYSRSDIDAGNMVFGYPLVISAGGSDLVTLRLKPSGVKYSFSVTPQPSVEPLPSDLSLQDSRYGEFRENLSIAKEMRAELTSPSVFFISPEFTDPKKKVYFDGNYTEWSWSIKAPDQTGKQVLVLKVYIDGANEPVFLRAFEVYVTSPTESTIGATPIPATKRIVNAMIDNSATVLGVVLTFITSILGLYFLYFKPKRKSNHPRPIKSNRK